VEQLLARGDRVRSFGRGAYPALEAMGVEGGRGDITDRRAVSDACAGVDCVFHTAAVAGIGVTQAVYTEMVKTNLSGTRNVLIGCRAHRVGRLVLTSSPSVTFAGVDQRETDERETVDM